MMRQMKMMVLCVVCQTIVAQPTASDIELMFLKPPSHHGVTTRQAVSEPLVQGSNLFPSIGHPRIPVLLVEFSDVTFSVPRPESTFKRYLNDPQLFTEEEDPEMGGALGMNYGSVARYFADMSRGAFQPEFHVYGPFSLTKPLVTYGKDTDNMTVLFRDVLKKADPHIDFSSYDANDDGEVDLVWILYAGYSEGVGGNPSDCIWPKSGSVTTDATYDGVKVSRYGVSNELHGTAALTAQYGEMISGIGVFCHEFCHCMGLPDLYPSPGSMAEWQTNQNPEYWDLMDSGEHANNGYCPVEMTAWERERLGWLRIDTLDSKQSVTLLPLSGGGSAYRLLNDEDSLATEYYIVENVQQEGWNSFAPSHGMLVWHVDYHEGAFMVGSPKVNQLSGHPRMTVVAADGMTVPSYYINKEIDSTVPDALYARYGGKTFTSQMFYEELAGDTFPGTTGVTALTDTTEPSARTFRGSGRLGKPITNIQEEDGIVTFNFMEGETSIPAVADYQHTDNMIYSLGGVPMGKDVRILPKGVYIIGKRKVVVR